ncbi:hypothetical protein JCM14469_14460 [Desulfatiferula olefinivorans]
MDGQGTVQKLEQGTRKKDGHTRKQERLLEFLNHSREKKFTGYIKINFSQGIIGRIEKFEEILK